ncbi:MAG: hypothetical protein IAG13_00700 [Deltaproteobacteria bacterium]|nr:hypothetical protein [Nannocystaceae bacterium]
MQRPGPWILVLTATACAQGSLENAGSSFGQSASATQVTTVADTGDDASSSSGAAETTSVAESSGASGTATATTTPTTEGGSSGAVESSSSGAQEESSSGAPITTMGVETSSSDDGTPPPPDASAWGSCDEADCEAGNDCLNITGLREFSPWCSPQCVVDLDCPAPPDGDAYIGCLASGEGEEEPTNCVLVCEYDGLDYGTCPTGMACAAVPDQATPISLCMWP